MGRKEPTFIKVCYGQAGEVWLVDGVYEVYRDVRDGKDALSVKQATQLGRFMKEFCDKVRTDLNETQFKKEDAFKHKDGRSASVFAFKPFKLRLYGVICQINNKKVFLGLKVDPEKKQDKANRALLERTAQSYFELSLKEVEVCDEREFDAAGK